MFLNSVNLKSFFSLFDFVYDKLSQACACFVPHEDFVLNQWFVFGGVSVFYEYSYTRQANSLYSVSLAKCVLEPVVHLFDSVSVFYEYSYTR